MNQLTKDQIKDRLLKRAAKHWGYSDVELENVFDPIVNLLFDVCAKELEKISNEIFSSRRRMTERLIDILTPIASAKATASRGILKAYPTENELVLNDFHQFSYQRKELNPYNPTENSIKSYYFGATNPTILNRNKINYVVLPNGVQKIEKEQFKEFVGSKNYLNTTPHATMWIGLKHEGDGIIKDLSFYFYLKNLEHKNTFFHFLPRAKWFLNDLQLTTKTGYNNNVVIKPEKSELMQQDFYHIKKAHEHINDYYKDNFISINDSIEIKDDSYSVPKEFEKFIPLEDLKKITEEKLLWIRIEFPNVVGKDILSEVFCANNCFPVMNKKLNETQGNIKDILNIYPLSLNNDYFLELLSVLNDKNKEFDIVSNSNSTSEEDYAYLRFGGISRFDERNATEEINYLIDLIRDEASAFSRLGSDFTDTNLKEINQIISRFKNKIAQIGSQTATNPYMILNTKDKNQSGTLFVKYWTTDGESANKISTFSKFTTHKGADFVTDSVLLLSATKGGKNELTNSEKIYAYRENLISNHKVVTRQDIIILCKNHYGDAIDSIEVKNGIQTSLDSTIGYMPTIDIYLEKSPLAVFNDEEWEFLRDDIKLLIENRAINIVPFRVVYKN
jgi:predicted nucleic-acid-binding protein